MGCNWELLGGLRVAYNVLEETSARVQQAVGMDFALLELIRKRDRRLGQDILQTTSQEYLWSIY